METRRGTMLKNTIQFKSEDQSFENVFYFETNIPSNLATKALLECLKWIGNIEDEAKAKALAEQKPEQPAEDVTNDQPAAGSEINI